MTYTFQPGERIQLHPATDMWMRGARYGAVVKMLPNSGLPNAQGIRPDRVRVRLDAWPRPLVFMAADVAPV